jgi:hypothetical protein
MLLYFLLEGSKFRNIGVVEDYAVIVSVRDMIIGLVRLSWMV